MDNSHSQSLFPSSDDWIGAGAEETMQNEHDILSFLSLFVSIVREMSTDLFLSSVVLGPTLDIQDPVPGGTFFSISLIEATDFARNLLIPPLNLSPLPPVLALKTPRLNGDANSPSNRRVFTSMATELQILRDKDIYSHENIVTLLGVCWQVDSNDRILPVFVMEAAGAGNLRIFLSERTLGLAEQVNLCIDIATGVSTIHDKGVIHGDIKPENILIFKSGPSSFVAKICDFGSSILEANAGPAYELKGGTKIWQAPEIYDASGPQSLRRADVYSLGLVLWYIFSHDAANAIIAGDPASLFETKASGELLETVMATLETEEEDGSQSYSADVSQLQQCILSSTLACTPTERWDMDAVVNCLFEIADFIMNTNRLSDATSEQERVIGLNLQSKISRRQMRLESSEQLHIEDQQSEDGILKVMDNQATMALLPKMVINELQVRLEQVAHNSHESTKRRARASYEYGIGALIRIRISAFAQADVEEPLAMLAQAASFGYHQAQYVVNMLHEAFEKPAPFDRASEIPWLVRGTIEGSLAARKRLECLDVQEAKKAIGILRLEYSGVGIRHERDVEYLQDLLELQVMDLRESIPRLLQTLVYVGRIADVQTLLSHESCNVNEVDPWGETALLVACRCGHSRIAELLLEAGADPTIASREKFTPLHFLSAFDEAHIPHLGNLLVASGAELEVRTISGTSLNPKKDGQFGIEDGTPLLWAVGAGSMAATKLLLELGADPFDIQGQAIHVAKKWENLVNFSPVDLAARLHQHQILKALLDHCSAKSPEVCETLLNSNFRAVAPHPKLAALPLLWAVTHTPQMFYHRLLIHGKNHLKACKQTIQTLIDHGASMSEIDNTGRSAIEIASGQGNIFLTAYLLQADESSPKFQPWQFLNILYNAARINDFETFNLLLEYGKDVALDDESVQHFYALTAETTNNTSFIDFFLDNERWNSLSERDDSEIFERALVSGNFEVARRVYERGRVDLCKRLSNKNGYSTIFGRLMVRAKKFKNGVDRVKEFLSIAGGAEEIFFNVVSTRGMEFTALHAACLYSNYFSGLAGAGPVMDAILERYNEPRHLNAQIANGVYAGFTALHLAVVGGNVSAVDRLLQTNLNANNLNINVLDDQGESPLDKVKMRWRNQARFMGGVPMEKRQAWKERHDNVTEKLTLLMEQSGARCRKYFAIVRKLDDSNIILQVFSTGESELIPLNNENFLALENTLSGLASVVLKLKPDHMFLMGSSSKTLNVEAEVLSKLSLDASIIGSNPVLAQWGTGSCQTSVAEPSTSAISKPNNALSRERVARDTELGLEFIGNPLSRIRGVKVLLDGDLGDFCDWIRNN